MRTSSRLFFISFSLLGVILIVAGAYVVHKHKSPVEEQITETFAKKSPEIQKQSKPEKPPGEIIPVIEPTIPTKTPIYTEKVQVRSGRGIVASVLGTPGVIPDRVPKFGVSHVSYDIPDAPEVKAMPDVVIYADIPTTTFPKQPPFSPLVSAPTTPAIEKSAAETKIRVARAPAKPKGFSIMSVLPVADTGLANMAMALVIGGEIKVKPLPKGEPGGRIIGRGKDVRGVFRLARVQHNLADWWADQSALVALVEWLNTQTKIKTDMNVEGGALLLTDPKLSKAPLVFFTGHDPAHVKTRNLMRGTPLRGALTKQERDAMRKYLVEDGGFIFFDDCGVNYASEAFVKLTLAQLRYAMPEYSVDRIPNDHEIYHNYYEMGGPPVGFDIFWWGTHPPKRNFLEGITIGDHLGALICRRDYMCSMETLTVPTRAVHHSPGVYRFCTNVVIYALTHGGISDYSKYVPLDTDAERIPVDVPTLVPTLE